jgi:dihydroorotate dehydrogenase electron transfer subunit
LWYNDLNFMPIQELARVIDNKEVAKEHYKLTFSSNYITSHAEPGQFVQIRCANSTDPLLRRPFSIHKINKESKEIEIIYRVIGKGTKIISNLQIGTYVDVLGPLGSGFKVSEKKQVAVFVGGGCGIAPLFAAAEEAKKHVKAVYAVIGVNHRDGVLCESDFKALGAETIVTTDDGSYGRKGVASDILLELLSSKLREQDSIIFACGPKPMLKAVTEIASQFKIDCQLSLDEWMACGIGACKGCAAETTSGYKMVCKDGPVFDSKEIKWR